MTEPFTHEPTRLLESGSDLGLRRDLELARATRVDYPVEAGLARFEASIAGASTLPAGGTVAGFAVLRWFIGASALLGVGVIAWLLAGDPESPAHAGSSAMAAIERPSQPEFRSEDGKVADESSVAKGGSESSPDPALRESVAETHQTGGGGEVGVPVHSAGVEPAGNLTASPRPTSKSSKPAAGDPALEEAKLIDAARKALSGDPARALELTEQAAERFPSGAMVEERRGYAILALLALDRRGEAEKLADDYLERWPKGPLSRRVRDGLGLLP
ncbi:hypothetical protein ACNOYE_34005 [Nannocystaceae bacterium ST9]